MLLVVELLYHVAYCRDGHLALWGAQVCQSSGIAAPPVGPPPMGTPMHGAPDPEVLPPPPFGLVVANGTRGSGTGSVSGSSYLRVSNTVSSSDDESYLEDQ